ncbi:MAG: hypothetical protein ACM3IJ_03450 [Candidatus Levyibacteriota bacterium]
MHAPLFSTISLIAELVVSSVIFYTFYSGYKKNKFPTIPAAAALIYEVMFNITYMVTRTKAHEGKNEANFNLLFGAFHGILSLVMFIALIVFLILAWKNYKKGTNYFLKHKMITFVFLFFWTLSVVSGIVFYVIEYLL